MRKDTTKLAACAALLAGAAAFAAEGGGPASPLRLVPFPKVVEPGDGAFRLDRRLILEAPAGEQALLSCLAVAELKRIGAPAPEVRRIDEPRNSWSLSGGQIGEIPELRLRDGATGEDYVLAVRPDSIACASPGPAGRSYGMHTICQLIRANRARGSIPCLTVRDWPSLRWRCFQDDMTRGPSSRLETLKREVTLGAALKMDLFTYYMEYQFAFTKHPAIGPKDGSLTPQELAALVAYAKPLHVDILANQQSFAHFERILRHKEYAHLGEAGYILSPAVEESYRLLDDLYSDVIPILPFPWFNVCCDETWDLGAGPSKALVDQIGVGGVYVRHIQRIHELLATRYKKRMMMWGDIILKHPGHLKDIPRDVIMLTWGYDPAPSFEGQIIPFATAGFDFFVCPGVSDWSRILPDFGAAAINIQNFVRDGAKHGALGMLNTAWEDDGEALNAPKWYGHAWGAECAWNASATALVDFNRRIGAVLFGETGDRFGRAIELLGQAHRLAGMQGMNNKRFWEDDFVPRVPPSAVRASATELLAIVRPALEHLEALRAEATANADLLPQFIFGARRMELIGQRMLDGLAACEAYAQAARARPEEAVSILERAEKLVRANRDAHNSLGMRFRMLWLAESKPYALDWTLARYDAAVKRFDDLLLKLKQARVKAQAGEAIPRPEEIGLAIPAEPLERPPAVPGR